MDYLKSPYRSARLPYYITDNLGSVKYDSLKVLALILNQAGFLNTGVEALLDAFNMQFDIQLDNF